MLISGYRAGNAAWLHLTRLSCRSRSMRRRISREANQRAVTLHQPYSRDTVVRYVGLRTITENDQVSLVMWRVNIIEYLLVQ